MRQTATKLQAVFLLVATCGLVHRMNALMQYIHLNLAL